METAKWLGGLRVECKVQQGILSMVCCIYVYVYVSPKLELFNLLGFLK